MKNSNNIEKMQITESAFNEIINFIGAKPAESGGALFGREDDYIIQKFVPDVDAKTSRATYTINTDYLNPVIKKLWEEEGLSLIGIVHSHPRGYSTLSGPDLNYFGDLLTTSITRKRFYAPIVFTIPDGGFKLFPHILNNEGEYTATAQLEIVSDNYGKKINKMPISKLRTKKLNKVIILRNFTTDRIIKAELFFLKSLGVLVIGYFLIRIIQPFTNYIIKILNV